MTIASVLLLAVIDSINPSAIVVTLWLLSTAGARVCSRVAVYVATIFVTYFLLGVMMVMGIGALLPSVGHALEGRPGFIVQSVIGLALLIYALTASKRSESPQVVPRPSAQTAAALILLGVTVTVMELPTAVPYFAATALILKAELPLRTSVPLLALYNVIFVLPPVALLVGYLVFRKGLAERYADLSQRLERGGRETMLWVAGLVGGWLFLTGAIELVARLR